MKHDSTFTLQSLLGNPYHYPPAVVAERRAFVRLHLKKVWAYVCVCLLLRAVWGSSGGGGGEKESEQHH